LTFKCTLAAASYDWTVTSFLDGTPENGRISVGSNKTVGEFSLSANGQYNNRTSTLQFTVFDELCNNTTVTCSEASTTTEGQCTSFRVLGEYAQH